MRRRAGRGLLALLATLATTGSLLTGPAASAAPAAPAECPPPAPSATQPGYTVADPRCDYGSGLPFTPLTGDGGAPLSRVYAGISGGAAYRAEVPARWNGELVLYAHGYRGLGPTVWVDSPSLREHYVRRGFAWAASSYQTNGYDVGQGARDTRALVDLFRGLTRARPRSVYLTGASMGGHVTVAAIERYRGVFTAAMPYCGVLADAALFDYFTDANVTAAALTRTPIEFPRQPPADYARTYQQQVLAELPKLGSDFAAGRPPTLTALGRHWAAAVEQSSGGTRPGFASSFGYWASFGTMPLTNAPFLFGLYPGLTGGTAGIAPGNVVDNSRRIYQLDGWPGLSLKELALNARVLRVTRTARPSRDLSGIPAVAGDPRIPVLSLHGIGDLFVPFSMEQRYAERTARRGQRHLFASRAIRATGHCDFTLAELQRGFDDLVRWVRTGHRADGDAVTDRRRVAHPAFGCRFTEGPHPNFTAAACPARGRN
jgi:fermentation-respiration switch protein FrsA (DUF1100 family)